MFDFGTTIRGEPIAMERPSSAPEPAAILRRLRRGVGLIVLAGVIAVALAVAGLGLLKPAYRPHHPA